MYTDYTHRYTNFHKKVTRRRSRRFFIFGHSPNRYRLRTSALNIDLPVTHLLLATRERVPRVKDA